MEGYCFYNTGLGALSFVSNYGSSPDSATNQQESILKKKNKEKIFTSRYRTFLTLAVLFVM